MDHNNFEMYPYAQCSVKAFSHSSAFLLELSVGEGVNLNFQGHLYNSRVKRDIKCLVSTKPYNVWIFLLEVNDRITFECLPFFFFF